ncbi:sensor histidine kinase [Oleisolibacter albus]|uniref:sensor histidine kinase n=1 Tax=Oleisolibacter albus TaxID=2171757 RepID=UPI000DF2434D|nr:ATP-binding protein [Oleisolibacter albus]
MLRRFRHLLAQQATFWLVAALLLLAFSLAAGLWAERVAVARLRDQAGPRLDLYAAGLESELGKYDPLPALLGQDRRLLALLNRPADPAAQAEANHYLEEASDLLRTAACYLVDPDGRTLAASNWNGPVSFVGRDFSYRPYVRNALAHGAGRFYGIGTTSREPGYYVARAIRVEDRVLGAAVVKVSLDRLERAWAPGAERVLVADANGVIILASEPGWKFRTLEVMPQATVQRLNATRQYDGVSLQPLGWQILHQEGPEQRTVMLAPGGGQPRPFLALARPLADTGWTVTVLYDLQPLAEARLTAMVVAAGAGLLLILGLLYQRQRARTAAAVRDARDALAQANAQLEHKVAERTAALSKANAELQTEVVERLRAEADLHRTQDGLVQAAKLAALGQLSAGVAHEVNQPLAALRTLSDNAAVFLQRGQVDRAAGNLSMISDLTERIARITGQLRNFARRSDNQPEPVDLAHCIAATATLLQERFRREAVDLQVTAPPGLRASCDANRLEQVLVNLLANAVDAVRGREIRRVEVAMAEIGDRVAIRVRDSGPGLTPEIRARLFEPFFTTKPQGSGLGLGLAISAGIVQGFGGVLEAGNAPGGGAEFTVLLPRAEVPLSGTAPAAKEDVHVAGR